MGLGYGRLEARRVDDSFARMNRRRVAGKARHESVVNGPVPDVVIHWEEPDPPRRLHALEHLDEIITDFTRGSPLIKAGVLTPLIDAVIAQDSRVHAIEGRGLVQSNERIGVVPMPPGTVASVNQNDVTVRCLKKDVGKGQPGCSCSDDQVIGLQSCHGRTIATVLNAWGPL
jgi:hypothetical protein